MSLVRKFVHALKTDAKQFREKEWHIQGADRQQMVWPLYILRHPFAGIHDIKYGKKGSIGVSLVVLLLFFLTNVLRFYYTGFTFNFSNIQQFNIVMELGSSIVLVVLGVVSNWSVCTLMDGEGKFREIWIVFSYALMPRVVSNLLYLLLSNWLVQTESVFLGIVDGIGLLWTLILLVSGILIVHQYSLSKTLACCLLTVVGIVAILFIAILFVSIIQQMFGFIDTVSVELLNRAG